MDICGGNIETLDSKIVPQVPKTLKIQDMDAEAESSSSGDDDIYCAPVSFLQKVYNAEVRDSNNSNKEKLLMISVVHAVMLEFGFVCVDSVNQKKIDGYHLPEGWNMEISNLSVKYTLPALVRDGKEVVETVILKFNIFGEFLCVDYWSLSMKNAIRLKLNVYRIVPSINYLLCASNCDAIGKKSSAKSFHEKEVFELWKTIRDRLAIPLSIDLCIKTGLELPPCFMCLPTELKIKIIELLPGIDHIANVGCLSSELRYLCSNQDLWKQKCVEEFSVSKSSKGAHGDWKRKYFMFKSISTNSHPSPLLPNRRWPRPVARNFLGQYDLCGFV